MNGRLEPHIRILLGSSIAIGPGKAALLEAISETGSIAAAGRHMGMSYRRAWLLAKTMNACFREPLIEADGVRVEVCLPVVERPCGGRCCGGDGHGVSSGWGGIA